MIIPVKKLTVITLIENENKLLESLGKSGAVQLQHLDDSEFVEFKEANIEEIRKYEIIIERLGFIKRKIDLICPPHIIKKQIENINEKTIEYANITIEEFEKKATSLIEIAESSIERLNLLKNAKSDLKILQDQGVNPENLGDFNYFFFKAGIVGTKLMPFIRLRLKKGEFITIKESNISPKETFVTITGVMELKTWIEKFLSTLEFKELKVSKELSSKFDKDLTKLDGEINKIENEIQKLRGHIYSLENISKRFLDISYAKSYLLRSKTMMMLQGWVPKDRINGLNITLENLNQETNGNIYYTFDDPFPGEELPTVMKNPKPFGTYEVLTRQFGVPDQRESDPTIISTILWITMFGIMFPDFGQGLVIFGLGIIFTYKIKRPLMGMNFTKIGRLMIGLGISATIFGLLTGEFFLTEIQPLWPGLMMAWVKNPGIVLWLIKIAVFFGIAQISVGLIIGIRNHLREGEKSEALLGEQGLAGLVTFIGVVIVASLFLGVSILPGFSFPQLKMDVISHWTMAIPIAGVIAISAKTIISGKGITMTIGLIIETLTACLANVLSYARIAGFCIAHATFALIVAKLFHANPMLGIGLGLIFLNIFSLTLELLVAMIQSLRLLYYEFGTKFFKGTGTLYVPYRLDV